MIFPDKNIIEEFTGYLKNKDFAVKTIKSYTKYIREYLMFLKNNNLTIEEAKYYDILTFIENLEEKGKSIRSRNYHLTAVRHLYTYLKAEYSPADGLYLKGYIRNIPVNLLSEKELEEIYEEYKVYNLRTKRNKVILGLFINQAITSGELEKLRPDHLKLERGKIIIPPGINNQRTLNLEAFQIMQLHEYINKIRPEILKRKNTKTDQLFISMQGKPELKGTLHEIFKGMKSKAKNANQIRISVITNKLKTNNLREVQYFAGHKKVSTTEYYKLGNIEDLKKDIEKYHPMK